MNRVNNNSIYTRHRDTKRRAKAGHTAETERTSDFSNLQRIASPSGQCRMHSTDYFCVNVHLVCFRWFLGKQVMCRSICFVYLRTPNTTFFLKC